MTMTTEKLTEAKELFASLSYRQQQKFLTYLHSTSKKPPYHILFKVDTTGLKKIGDAVAYCAKYSIPYTAEKVNATKVKLTFNGQAERNAVLIGCHTLST